MKAEWARAHAAASEEVALAPLTLQSTPVEQAAPSAMLWLASA